MEPRPPAAQVEYARATMPGKAYGHIIGYRFWCISVVRKNPLDVRLSSLVMNGQFWPPGEPAIAQDARADGFVLYDGDGDEERGEVPGPGFYAYNTRMCDLGLGIIPIMGTVALWGHVVECTRGYRGQYAYPTALWLRRRWAEQHLRDGVGIAELMHSLEDNYQVPVRYSSGGAYTLPEV